MSSLCLLQLLGRYGRACSPAQHMTMQKSTAHISAAIFSYKPWEETLSSEAAVTVLSLGVHG